MKAALAIGALLLIAATPPAPFDLASLAVGKPAIGVAQTPGRAVVIVAFASWCGPCVQEMPEVIADYQRFKDRVDFVGVDYLDSPAAGDAMIAKYAIPFPVLRSRSSADVPAAAGSNEALPISAIRLEGVTPKTLPAVIGSLHGKIAESSLATLRDVAAYCEVHSDAQCIDYAGAHNVQFSSVTAAASPAPTPASKGSTTSIDATVDLPHLFIVDGKGVVRVDFGGYTLGSNAIATSLAKLGIK